MGDKLEYDYVIIGSGAAGGTIFDKLSNFEVISSDLRYLPDLNITSNIIALACIISGFIIVLYIENYASRKKNIRLNRKEH